jgi:hypothetical protein
MDVTALQAALRASWPTPDEREADLHAAVRGFEEAVRRSERADAQAAQSRRQSTLKATLKTAAALERARAHLLAELRLVNDLRPWEHATPGLRLCT